MMGRSGYADECESEWALIRWRGAVASAIRGTRGQTLLQEMADAFDEIEKKELIANSLEADGQYCALGVLGARRGIDMTDLDPYDTESVATVFNIAPALAREIVWMNDEAGVWKENPTARFARMRAWVSAQISSPNRMESE
jgi:hypothetical protein